MMRALNISLPTDLVKIVDTAATSRYQSRSDYIRESLVMRLNDERIIKKDEVTSKDLEILKHKIELYRHKSEHKYTDNDPLIEEILNLVAMKAILRGDTPHNTPESQTDAAQH